MTTIIGYWLAGLDLFLVCLFGREGGGGVYPFHALSRDHIIVAGAGAGSI